MGEIMCLLFNETCPEIYYNNRIFDYNVYLLIFVFVYFLICYCCMKVDDAETNKFVDTKTIPFILKA